MIRDNAKLALSIIYLQIVALIWVYIMPSYLYLSFSNFFDLNFPADIIQFFLNNVETSCFVIGSILLIPSGILYIVSYNKRKFLANFAFGLGVPAWVLILISFGISNGINFYYLLFPALGLIPTMLFGVILFSESIRHPNKIIKTNTKKQLYYGTDLRKQNRQTTITRYKPINRNPIPQRTIHKKYPSRTTPTSRIQRTFKYCSQCGTKLKFYDKYCYHCGYPQWLR